MQQASRRLVWVASRSLRAAGRSQSGNCRTSSIRCTSSFTVIGTNNNSQQQQRYPHRSSNIQINHAACRRGIHNTAASFNDDYPPHVLFPMPALSPTMEMGTIASWSLKEGDSFSAGDVLCSIETDKASVDYEAQDDGYLAKILRDGSNAVDLPIGTPICVIAEEAEDVAAFGNYQVAATDSDSGDAAAVGVTAGESTPPTSNAQAAAAAATSSATASKLGNFVLMPSARHLSESKGLDATVLAPGSGKGGRVTKGDVLQGIASNSLPPLAVAAVAPASAAAAPPPPAAAPAAAPLSLSDLIVPEIVTEGGTFEDVPNNKMRKIIASRLTESKSTVPHFYTSFTVALDQILALRKRLVKDHEVKVSVNDFVIKCSALALRDVPEVNGTQKSTKDDGMMMNQYSDSIDISVAVATPTGLITPIVFDTDKLGLAEISSVVRDLATRARDGKLAPHEYQGGTFSVSNLGMFGISEFSAVINPPQAAILAVGAGIPTFVPTPYKDGQDEQPPPPSIANLLTARLSADRRVVDEATASLFGQAFSHYMNQPQLLLL